MMTLQFYTRRDCTLCHSALSLVCRLQKSIPFELDIIDIDENPVLCQRYDTVIPVITCGEIELACSFVDEKMLREALKKLAAPA